MLLQSSFTTWRRQNPIKLTKTIKINIFLRERPRCSSAHLHQEHVLVAVEPEHVVVDLGQDPGLALAVEVADVGRVDLVLALDGLDQAGQGRGDLRRQERKGDKVNL